jgi:serine/threonine-protein kinase HipA
VSTTAAVMLWGTRIGAVSLEDGARHAAFQYDPAFLPSGIQVAPLMMPLRPAHYVFPDLSQDSFHGLPGLLADSLPDRFGNALVDAWLASQGRRPEQFNSVERLCYTGTRGMGALEFAPARGPDPAPDADIQIAALAHLASQVLASREAFVASLRARDGDSSLAEILRVGTSAGGARAKAVIAYNPTTGAIRSGQIAAGSGFEHWLLKFDGVRGNRDKELDDPAGFGAIEHAYHLMAREAGIEMAECRILEEGGRRHFLTRRFDRSLDGDKIHMQSLAALAHLDYNMADAHSYEQAFAVARRLALGVDTLEEVFRRMTFNIVARNHDDHVKNMAFLMDRRGEWRLAPAFDVTYAYAPEGAWTSRHQMSMNGKRDDFTMDDFVACGRTASLKRGRARVIVAEVSAVVGEWRTFAKKAEVDGKQARQIARAHRLSLRST